MLVGCSLWLIAAFGAIGFFKVERLSSAVVAAPMLVLPVLAVVWSLRWTLARRQIDRPRGIMVPDLRNGSGEDAPVDRLTALFRERLTRVGLTPPGPTPAAAPPSEALTLIRAAGRERAPLAAVAGLAEAAIPPYGYQVLGTLVVRDTPPIRGVVTRVIDADGRGSQPAARWADTWDEAVEQSAYEAAAYVLPRVRADDTVRWVGWYGIDMPAALLHHFVRAERLVAKRRYDEALDHYFRAVEHDPQSLDLRLEIGNLQEQLNLWLDALVTYNAAIDLAEKQSFAKGVRWSPERRAERRARARATYLLRYRRAILLGSGEHLADQWMKTGDTGRDRERATLRMLLRPWLRGHERASAKKFGTGAFAVILDETGGEQSLEVASAKVQKERRLWLRRLFQFVSQQECEKLCKEHREIAAAGTRITRASLKVAEFWACVQLEATAAAGAGRKGWEGPTKPWLTDADELERALEKRLKPRLRSRRDPAWVSSYNAACTCAIAYSACRRKNRDVRDKLRDAAVDHLEIAVRSSDPALLRGRRSWLLTGDPDFDDLRPTDRFRRFEAEYLPTAAPPPRGPRKVHDYQVASYVRALIAASAEALEHQWHARTPRTVTPTDPHEPLAWCRQEAEAWARIEAVAGDHGRWQTRAALVRAIRGWSPHRPVRVPHPDYTENPLPEGGDVDRLAAEALIVSDRRLEELCGRLAAIHANTRSWIAQLEKADAAGEPVPAQTVAALGTTHAALWAGLAAWMRAPVCPPARRPSRGFRAAIAALSTPPASAA